MFSEVKSCVVQGISGEIINIETHIQQGMPQYHIVGLPSQVIRESKERVRAALSSIGHPMPLMRITQNMSPAHLRKEGSQLDLALCIGIISAQDAEIALYIEDFLFVGELSLDGQIKPVSNIYSILEGVSTSDIRHVVLPKENICDADIFKDINLYGFDNLKQLINDLKNKVLIPSERSSKDVEKLSQPNEKDYSDLKGQDNAVRALEIAIAGGHNILFVGPPGCGKTMMIERLETILPNLDHDEMLKVTQIARISENILNMDLIRKRPIRTPHHTVTRTGMLGGGSKCLPGEITKSHAGVLVLDELTEFKREVIESLREPLSFGIINLAKNNTSVTYPSHFQLIATMNPCHCGYRGSKAKSCTCSQQMIKKYDEKLSGPIYDRIDMIIYMDRVEVAHITTPAAFTSDEMKSNIQKIFRTKQLLSMDQMTRQTIQKYYESGKITMRRYEKIKRIANTIALMAGKSQIDKVSLMEAMMLHGQLFR